MAIHSDFKFGKKEDWGLEAYRYNWLLNTQKQHILPRPLTQKIEYLAIIPFIKCFKVRTNVHNKSPVRPLALPNGLNL